MYFRLFDNKSITSAVFKFSFCFKQIGIMPLLSVNMAVPVKDHIRDSHIYLLARSENVAPENPVVAKKYLIFKTFELVLSLCSLMLFAYCMRSTKNEILDMLKYITLGGLTIYPLLYILLSISVKERPILSIILNATAAVALFTISATTISDTTVQNENDLDHTNREEYSEAMMKLRSIVLLSTTGILYSIECLIVCIEIRKTSTNNQD